MKTLLALALTGLVALCSPAWADPNGAVSPGTAGTQSFLMGCYRPGTTPAPATGQQMAVSCDANGNLVTTGGGGGGGGGTSSNFGATFPTAGTAIGVKNGANMVDLTADGSNNLNVDVATSVLPTGAATSANQTNASQKTQIVDGSGNVIASTSNNLNVQCANCSGSGASATDGASFTAGTSVFAPGGGFFQTTATNNPLTTGQQGFFQMTATRSIFTNLRNAAGTEVGTSTTPLQVSLANTGANGTAIAVSAASLPLPTGAATAAKQPALGTAGTPSADVLTVQGAASMTPFQIGGLTPTAVSSASNGFPITLYNTSGNAVTANGTTSADGVATSGTGTILRTNSFGYAFDGTTIDRVRTLPGLTTSGIGVLAAGLVGFDGTNYDAAKVDTSGNQIVVGAAANNASASGNPLPSSCLAVNVEATVATNGQNAECVTDLAHKQIVLPYANPENFVSGTTAAMTGTTSTSLLAAPAAGLRNYVTQLTCVNSHATVGTFVTVQDGSGGTALYTLAAASAFGGSTITFPTPLRQPTTATALFVADVTTGANVICSGTGYKGS